MAFYSDFSGYYETVFPFRAPVLELLNRRLPGQGRVLDLGCGTGAYCGRLARDGRSCLGVDLDSEMVRQAAENHPGVEFQVLDLASIDTLPEGDFTGAYCIGNVLPHLGPGQLPDFLSRLKRLLRPAGIWIFQTVNFDPIVGQDEFVFPVLDYPDQALQFFRQYTDISDRTLKFQTRLVHAGREIFAGEVTLSPRTTAHCLELHRQAGFELIDHFADFTGKKFVSSEHSGSVYIFSAPEES